MVRCSLQLQPAHAATPAGASCNANRHSLQRQVAQAATPCGPGCNPRWPRLQPRVRAGTRAARSTGSGPSPPSSRCRRAAHARTWGGTWRGRSLQHHTHAPDLGCTPPVGLGHVVSWATGAVGLGCGGATGAVGLRVRWGSGAVGRRCLALGASALLRPRRSRDSRTVHAQVTWLPPPPSPLPPHSPCTGATRRRGGRARAGRGGPPAAAAHAGRARALRGRHARGHEMARQAAPLG